MLDDHYNWDRIDYSNYKMTLTNLKDISQVLHQLSAILLLMQNIPIDINQLNKGVCLNPNDISIEEELEKEIYLFVNFYDKVSSLENKSKIIGIYDNVTDDITNFGDEFRKTKDYIRRGKIKNVCVT